MQLIDGPEASYLAKHIIECAQPDVRYHCFLSVLPKEVIIFHMPSIFVSQVESDERTTSWGQNKVY